MTVEARSPAGQRAFERQLWAVLGVGLVVRLVLLPLTHGQDFVVWDKATAATLHGVNVYTHHPRYPGGPYAYLPLFLYVELPFQFVAMHTGISFTVLGKIPMVVGDLATGALLADAVRWRGGSERRAVVAAAVFVLNPLVLYDSAWYGRFDTLGCALLLLSLRRLRRREPVQARAGAWFGLAVAAKTFPVFVTAGMLHAVRGARVRFVLTVAAVLTVVVLPYVGSLHTVYRDVVSYDLGKIPQGLSWQTLLLPTVPSATAKTISRVLLTVFAVATIWLSAIADLDRYVALTLVLFLCLSKVVLEQYLVWPLPWLVLLAVAPGHRVVRHGSAVLGVLLTAIGSFDNEAFHPFGRESTPLALALLFGCLCYLAALVVLSARADRTDQVQLWS